jgi:hypothetical protein
MHWPEGGLHRAGGWGYRPGRFRLVGVRALREPAHGPFACHLSIVRRRGKMICKGTGQRGLLWPTGGSWGIPPFRKERERMGHPPVCGRPEGGPQIVHFISSDELWDQLAATESKNRIQKCLQLRAGCGGYSQVLVAQDSICISHFGIVVPTGADPEYLLDVV